MTKVEMSFELARPVDEPLMRRLAEAHGIYGFYRVRLADSLDQVSVEYDASRLVPAQVEAALHRAGIPVRRIS